MILQLLIATVIALGLSYIVWRLPSQIRTNTIRIKGREMVTDHFYAAAAKVVKDDRSPDSIVHVLEGLSNNLNNWRLPFWLVWKVAVGRVQQHSEKPPADMEKLNRDVAQLPEDLRKIYFEANACGFIAIMLSAGFAGEVFLRFLMPSRDMPTVRQTAAGTFVPEMLHAA